MNTTDPAELAPPHLAAAYAALAPRGARRLLELARDEDLGPDRRDLASETLTPTGTAFALRARAAGTLAGLAALPELIEIYSANITLHPHKQDGDRLAPGDDIARLAGDPADILRLERPALNLLSRLSGVATLAAQFVAAVEGTDAVILDTRKTTPGLRALEKYAARCGGATNHRLGLDDAAMFKDNHLASLPLDEWPPALAEAARRAKQAGASFVEVETDTLDQLDKLLEIDPGLIDTALLDNMTADDMRTAVQRRNAAGSPMKLEASGGVTLDTVRAVAETGVDHISAGAITHSAAPIDLALDALKNA